MYMFIMVYFLESANGNSYSKCFCNIYV